MKTKLLLLLALAALPCHAQTNNLTISISLNRTNNPPQFTLTASNCVVGQPCLFFFRDRADGPLLGYQYAIMPDSNGVARATYNIFPGQHPFWSAYQF